MERKLILRLQQVGEPTGRNALLVDGGGGGGGPQALNKVENKAEEIGEASGLDLARPR